jgi:cell division protein FtsQ
MSDDTIFKKENTINADMSQRRFTNAPKIEKTLRWVIVIALVILGGELIMILIVNPCLPLSKIEVIGMPELDKTMVLEKAGITAKSSYVSVNARTAERRLKTLPILESVKVVKRFPDSVRINLEGRKAVAVSFVMIDGNVCPVFFDKRGMVFMIGNEGHIASSLSIPIISGLIHEEPFLGMQVSVLFSPLLSNLDSIRTTAPELLVASNQHSTRAD